tara:strand:+ start:19379 stop:19939 length:561 start_codon:yes stop_codon:yes gene_type:complete
MKKWLAINTKTIAAISSVFIALRFLLRLVNFKYLRIEVDGLSMAPALHPSDFLVVEKSNNSNPHQSGSIVAMQDSKGNILIKRIIGIPGESIQVGNNILINGHILNEPYAWGENNNTRYRGVNRLEQDEYFLVGDNRSASKPDSRDFGPVRAERIIGTVIFCYWPFTRIGKIKTEIRKFSYDNELK